MNKKVYFVMVMICSIVLGACGGSNSNDAGDKVYIETSTNESVEQEVNEEAENIQEESEIILSYSHKVPGKNIVIDVPNWQEMEKGFTRLFILHGIKYVAISCDKESTVTELNAAHEDAFDIFKGNIQNYSYVNSLSVTTDSVETINGIEVYKYEGTLNCGVDNIYDAYVIGYSFIMDGVPCNITGSVIDQAQEQDMIDEMKATVEAMIQTLRSER